MSLLNENILLNWNILEKKSKELFGLISRNPKPHFLGIGTQKGGTTTLYRILKQHQDIFLPDNKEIHYFTKFFQNGDNWYINHFREAPPGKLRGEITPYYLFHEAVPQRIYEFNNKMKLIVLLRDPVERALSQYFHSVRLGLEDLPLEEALSSEEERLANSQSIISIPGKNHISHQEHSYVSRSRYDIQIKRYMNYFENKNLLILKSEDFFKDHYLSLKLISKFLGINSFQEGIQIPKANSGNGESMNVNLNIKHKIANELSETYKWLKENYSIAW